MLKVEDDRRPRPPASETAATRGALDIHCMQPWIMGYSMPSISVTLVLITFSFLHISSYPFDFVSLKESDDQSSTKQLLTESRVSSASFTIRSISVFTGTISLIRPIA